MEAIKSNSINETKAIEIFGKDAVEKVKSLNCEFTNRCIDDCFGVVEMSASLKINDESTLVILYLIDKADVDSFEDEGNFDYSNYTFEVI